MKKIVLLYLFFSAIFIQGFGQDKTSQYFTIVSDYEKGNFREAMSFSDSLAEAYPLDRFFIELNADLYFKSGNYNIAFEKYFLLMPYDSAGAFINMARCASLLKNYDTAISLIEQYFNLTEVYDIAEVKKDSGFSEMKNSELWVNFWNSFSLNIEKENLAELQYLYSSQKYNEVVNSDFAFKTEYYEYHAQILKIDAFTSIKDFNSALNASNALIKTKYDYEVLKRRADIYTELRQPSKAFDDLTACIAINPYNRELYVKRAVASNNCKRYSRAVDDFKYYLSFFDNDEKVWYNYGVVLFNDDKLTDAIEVFSKLLLINSSNAEYFMLRGDAYSDNAQVDLAMNDYLMALDIDPVNSDAYFKLGWCEYRLNDTKKACYYWNKAKHYNHADAESIMQRYCQ